MKILVFAPFSEIWPHSFPEALISEALQKYGHEIVYVGCGRALRSLCVVQQSRNLKKHTITEAQRDKLCAACTQYKKLIKNEFHFSGPDLSSFIADEDIIFADGVTERLTPDMAHHFVYEDIPVGSCALYTTLLQFKKNNLEFTPEEFAQYREAIRNCLLTIRAGKKILDVYKPDMVITYNNLYEVNGTFTHLARQRGLRIYSIHGQGNLAYTNGLLFSSESNFGFGRYIRRLWPTVRHLPCPPAYLSKVTDHLLTMMEGLSALAYSAPKQAQGANTIPDRLGIPPGARVLCAAMSSYDERFAAEATHNIPLIDNVLFKSSLEWIQGLVAYVQNRPDLFLIVRVHPREFPNKREGETSTHAKQLRACLQNLPKNVVVNWPEDNISLYDLAHFVHVFLTTWSSVGKEMAMLGLPVVVYSKDLLFYPADLHECGETAADYFAAIEAALKKGWDFERIRMIYRWQAIEFNRASISLEESLATRNYKVNSSFLALVFRKLKNTFYPLYDARRAIARRAKHPRFAQDIHKIVSENLPNSVDVHDFSPASENALEQETQALRHELGRLLAVLYPQGCPDSQPGSLYDHLRRASSGEKVGSELSAKSS